jgi:hypothetical protein
MGQKFSTASERISQIEDDFTGVCEVLAGRSRWQEFIRPNIGPALKKYFGRTFNIVSAQTFGQRGGLDPETQGLTDKVKPEIVFVEIFEHEAQTLVVFALHEMVHWVSHPPEQGHRLTAWLALDEGLIEGLTQVVTEDIFEDQGISQYWKAIYSERVAIVRKLIERFGVQPFGEVLFRGHPQALQPLLDTYGGQGMQQIKTLAKANNSRKAIECIDNLNRAFDAKPKRGAASRAR